MNVADASAGVAERAEAGERLALLGKATGRLPGRCREVFVLHKIHALSRRETAERIGLSENMDWTQIARAMERCGAYLRRRADTVSSHEAQP